MKVSNDPPYSSEYGHSGSGRLPERYTNPWVTFRKSCRVLAAHLGLRSRELFRRNWEGELLGSKYFPKKVARLLFPFLIVACLSFSFLLIQFFVQHLSVRWSSDTYTENLTNNLLNEETAQMSTSDEMLLNDRTGKLENDQNSNTYMDLADDFIEQESLRESFLDTAVPKELIELAAISPLKNVLALKLSSAWSELSLVRKNSLAQHFQVQANELGYAELELIDKDGYLLGRTSRVGSGMIMFNLSSD